MSSCSRSVASYILTLVLYLFSSSNLNLIDKGKIVECRVASAEPLSFFK